MINAGDLIRDYITSYQFDRWKFYDLIADQIVL